MLLSKRKERKKLKLFHLQEISPSGWVLLPSNKVKTVNKKTTHCAYEYIISHKHIKKADKDDIVKYENWIN